MYILYNLLMKIHTNILKVYRSNSFQHYSKQNFPIIYILRVWDHHI